MTFTILTCDNWHMVTSMLDVVTYDDFLNLIDDMTGRAYEPIEIVNVDYDLEEAFAMVEVYVTPKAGNGDRYLRRYKIQKSEVRPGRAFRLPN